MKENQEKEKEKKPLNTYIKFAALGLQMVITIVLNTFLGAWLDTKFEALAPAATIVGALLGVFIALFLVYKEVKSL